MHHLINILVAGTLAATALALLDQRDQTQVEPRLVYEDSHGNKIDDPADEIGIPFGNRDPYYVYPSPPKVVDDLNQEESSDEFSIATPPFDKIKKKQKLLFFYDLKVNLSNWRISVSGKLVLLRHYSSQELFRGSLIPMLAVPFCYY